MSTPEELARLAALERQNAEALQNGIIDAEASEQENLARARQLQRREQEVEASIRNAEALKERTQLDERERLLAIREQSASEAMQAAQDLMTENLSHPPLIF